VVSRTALGGFPFGDVEKKRLYFTEIIGCCVILISPPASLYTQKVSEKRFMFNRETAVEHGNVGHKWRKGEELKSGFTTEAQRAQRKDLCSTGRRRLNIGMSAMNGGDGRWRLIGGC
jgi:hypothetical protein